MIVARACVYIVSRSPVSRYDLPSTSQTCIDPLHSTLTGTMEYEKQNVVGDAIREVGPSSTNDSRQVVQDDPSAPSTEVSSKRQSLSDLFTIVSLYYLSHLTTYLIGSTVLRWCSSYLRWLPKQFNDHDQRPLEKGVPKAIHFCCIYQSIQRTSCRRDLWTGGHWSYLRLHGKKGRHHLHNSYDCLWRYPCHSSPWSHNSRHVLDADYCSRYRWFWYRWRVSSIIHECL